MASRPSVAQRVKKHRSALRAAGLRPVQIWGAGHPPGGFCGGMPASVPRAEQGPGPDCNLEVAVTCGGYGRLEVTRGDPVTIVLPGANGKPHPALVIQSDLFEALASVTVLPVTSELRALRFCGLPSIPVPTMICEKNLRSWWTRCRPCPAIELVLSSESCNRTRCLPLSAHSRYFWGLPNLRGAPRHLAGRLRAVRAVAG
jgi:Protein  of unknown function (DUF3018)